MYMKQVQILIKGRKKKEKEKEKKCGPTVSDFKTKQKVPSGATYVSHLGPVTWNKLPYPVRYAATTPQFKTQLKTTPFLSAHGPNS